MSKSNENFEKVIRNDPMLCLIADVLGKFGKGKNYIAGLYLLMALLGLRSPGVLIASKLPDLTSESLFGALKAKFVMASHRSGCLGNALILYPAMFPGRTIVLEGIPGKSIGDFIREKKYTCTSLALDVLDMDLNALIDDFSALSDIKEKKLKRIFPGALSNSVSSVLTAIFLRGEFDFVEDEDTFEEIKKVSRNIQEVSGVQAGRYVLRLFSGGNLARKAFAMERFDFVSNLIPEVSAIVGVPQNYYHHLGVWEHTLEALSLLEKILDNPSQYFKSWGERISKHFGVTLGSGFPRKSLLAFAALIHDAGKAPCMKVEASGRIRFQGHHMVGAKMADAIARRLGFDRKSRKYLVSVVGNHMELGFLLKEGETDLSRLSFVRETGSNCLDIAILSLADRLATRGVATTDESLKRFARLVTRLVSDYFWYHQTKMFISYKEARNVTGIRDGSVLREMLFDLKVAMRQGIIDSKEEALEFLAPQSKGKYIRE